MFGIGMNEMLIIAIIALVVIGPKRLPAVARSLGGMMAQFRRASNDLRDVVNNEISSHAELNEIKETHSALQNDLQDFRNTARRYIDEGAESIKDKTRDFADPGQLTGPGNEAPGDEAPASVQYGGLPIAGDESPKAPPEEAAAVPALEDDAAEPASGVAPEDRAPDLADAADSSSGKPDA